MSTILKALRRLEEEKASAESSRPLREQIAATAPAPPESSGRGWLSAVLALVVSAFAGGGLIWWLYGGEQNAGVEQVAAMPPAEAQAPTPAQQAGPAAPSRPATPAAGPPRDAFASDVDVVRRPERIPRLADADPVQPKPAPTAGARRPVEDSVAMARANAQAQAEIDQLAEMDRRIAEAQAGQAPAPAPVVREAQPQASPTRREPAPTVAKAEPKRAVAQAEPAPERTVAKPTPAPVAPKPAPKVVAAAPEPKPAAAPKPAPVADPEPAAPAWSGPLVEKTKWHPTAERRSAWLSVGGEPREVVEGDVVDGATVREIQPSGVMFERDGESTRRGVGEK